MYIGDLHIHSRYSRATSRDCTPEQLDLWARRKGIDILGTGDFTHPAWRKELEEKLAEAEDGLYVLKEEYRLKGGGAPDSARPRFVVTGEISSIYKKLDRVRKVHSLILLPSLEDADRLSRRLELIGNIHSDGRPILGLDCRDLLEIMMETCPGGIYVPAHIWTPHFSLFGAFSGFDRIEDCYGDLTPYIHALETGLSSDPPMNWRVSALDGYSLISNSDAHSPAKLGREANLFDIELSYAGLSGAINGGKGLEGTLEFFPEEGKYHLDGHRKCGLCLTPEQTAQYGGRCPVCGRKLTIGVLHRVEELADCAEGRRPDSARGFESLVPLQEVIGASTGRSAASRIVLEQYESMLQKLGPEFYILREAPVEDIRRAAGGLAAEGIRRLREGQVERTPGYDGEYGTVCLLRSSEISRLEGQECLFTPEELEEQENRARLDREESGQAEALNLPEDPDGAENPDGLSEPCGAYDARGELAASHTGGDPACPVIGSLTGLNDVQEEAVRTEGRAVAVIAGPGSGKTRTLISRLSYLIGERGVKPSEITAVTFTNKAAEEIRKRLESLPYLKGASKHINIGTFHSICSRLLTESGITFRIADEGLQSELAVQTAERFGLKVSAASFLRLVSAWKNGACALQSGNTGKDYEAAFEFYRDKLRSSGAFDYDDLLLEALRLNGDSGGEGEAEAAELFDATQRGACENASCGKSGSLKPGSDKRPVNGSSFASFLLVDEFQDINPVQYKLIKSWNRSGRELFVIGDPDQAIYGFRGSDPRCFARLREDYPELRELKLIENYRSTPEILCGALGVISNNRGNVRHMEAVRSRGRKIRVAEAPDERGEAIFVAKEINRLIGGIDMLDVQEDSGRREKGVRSFSDIAVLYRTHRQAAILEYCLRQEGIPYVVAGREDFLLESRVRGTLYFFEALLHPELPEAGELAKGLLDPVLPEAVREDDSYLKEKYGKTVRKNRPAKLLAEWTEEFGLSDDESMNKLINMSVLHTSMDGFLETLSLGEDGDIKRSGGRRFVSDAVTLMTFHGSKGLEFPAVFLFGARQGLAPLEFSGSATDIEEERRLFYVGMTRASEELIITVSGAESPFLKEIPETEVEREKALKEKQEEAEQLSLFDFI